MGELVALPALTNVLNYLKVPRVDITKVSVAEKLAAIILMITCQLTEKFGITKVKEMLKDIVNSCYDSTLENQKAEGYIILKHGFAMIPLSGINVPFHSRYLWSSVTPFRACKQYIYPCVHCLSRPCQIFEQDSCRSFGPLTS